MYSTLKNLIQNRRYQTEIIQRKLDIYLLANRISEEEYTELIAMIN